MIWIGFFKVKKETGFEHFYFEKAKIIKNTIIELAAEKLRLMKHILEIDDDKLISALLDLLTMTKSENSLTEAQHQELLFGTKQLDEGRHVSLKDFLGK